MKPDITELKSTLSKKEFERFGKFIRSPFFNTEQRFISLYNALAEGKPGRKELAEKIFGPEAEPSEDRFRKLVSEFMNLYKRFLAECEFGEHPAEQKLMLLERYMKSASREDFLKHANETVRFLGSSKVKDEIYYRNMVSALSMQYAIEDVNTKDSSKDTSIVLNHYTDRYFASMKMFIFQRLSSLEYTFSANLDEHKTFYKELGEFIEKNSDKLKQFDPEIYLRYIELKLDTESFSEERYSEYLETLESQAWQLNLYANYSSLLNLLSKFVNSGDRSFQAKILELSDQCQRLNLYKNHGISYIDYKIIIENAIRIGEYDKALAFAQTNSDFLNHDQKQSISQLMLGKIYFFKKEFNNAKTELSKVSITDYIHYIEAKLITCRIEFEQENYETVFEYVNTVKKFLKQHSDIGRHFYSVYTLFLKAFFKLARISASNLTKQEKDLDLGMLKHSIQKSETPMYASSWLVGKIEEKMKADQ